MFLTIRHSLWKKTVPNMANRDNHYEAAFEELLRQHGVPYIAVDEAKRSVLADGQSIKSLDFIVASQGRGTWLVDVKGRRFPSGDDESKQYWRNWSTRDDLASLAQWEELFGQSFCGLLVFAYNIVGDPALARRSTFRVSRRSVRVRCRAAGRLRRRAHDISESWDTVAMPTAEFRQLARPFMEFLAGSAQIRSSVEERSGASFP